MTGSTLPVATAREPILRVSHLFASYRTEEEEIAAVRDVSLDLVPGEVLALVGESAAGKSSVAHAILGLLPHNASMRAGEISYRGQSLLGADANTLRRVRGAEISMIFQDALAALTPTLRIGEQLAELFRAHRGLDDGGSRDAALAVLRSIFPDAERVADAFPFQLSGGMAQRVMMALATALSPKVIIADEPTANLDPAVRMEMLQRLEELRDTGDVAILVITHDFGVVARIADRVGVMYAGEIVEAADVRSIFRWPRHPYTFGLLQSLPNIRSSGRLEMMAGQPPNMAALAATCPFLPRCRKATSRCRVDDAPVLEVVDEATGHLAACYNRIAVPLRD